VARNAKQQVIDMKIDKMKRKAFNSRVSRTFYKNEDKMVLELTPSIKPSDQKKQTDQERWEAFLNKCEMLQLEQHVIANDIIKVYLNTTNECIRSLARAYLEKALPPLNNERLFYAIASSMNSETDFAISACRAYMRHPRRNPDELIKIVRRANLTGVQDDIIRNLLELEDGSLHNLQILQTINPSLFTEDRLAYLNRLMELECEIRKLVKNS
jgi:hypothetical protein